MTDLPEKSDSLWTPRLVTIALAQFAMTANPEQNLSTALAYIQQAADHQADIVCLPELFHTLYFCRDEHATRDFSEALPGEVGSALSAEAKRLGVAVVGGSVCEAADAGHRYNTSLVIDKTGEILGSYRKTHIPHDPAFFEMNYFEPGNSGFKVFDVGFAKIGVLICFDQWFPEAARSLALAGAEIIFYPTAIARVEEVPQDEGNWQHAWESVQVGHAVANNLVVCPVNRVGRESSSTFWGGSFICNAFGKILAKGSDQPELVVAQVDLAHSQFVREGWRFFESRRPDQYKAIVTPKGD
jgi:predicted amidohydrolase